ncbi:hypothetical protein DAPPUDRAFT_264514 [Daphnia pulex]|uniref:Uncharacterized protein n=1 Tax=Daphnia pulex TaxID=6669 RepID=E9HRR6_DAPPU|nr:hypothetical protein DAPPUDRAFT_264514 [Daphnia pulex]|eukprot:EFX65575.1 hypothetical protein DAPPUDRAFT_264514 [Daphnia pulex]
MDFISRLLTESQTRLSAVNLNKIEPDNFCTTKPVIDDGFMTTSEDKLNQQTILRFMAKVIEENNQILLEKERLTNQVSLLQSQLTDSNSKLRQYQNVHDELATTKSELEETKREMTDITVEKNLRLTNEDSRLRRELEDRPTNRLVSSRGELENLQVCLEQLDKVNEDLAVAKSEIESKNKTISDLETDNLRLAENVSQVRRKMEDIERLHLSNHAELEKLRVSREHISLFTEQQLDKVHKVLATNSSDLQLKDQTISELERENLRLAESNSQLRRQLEETNLLLVSSEAGLEELKVLRTGLQLDKVHEDLAAATREIESKNKIISELITELLRLAENNSQLRRELNDTARLLLSSQSEMEELRLLSRTEQPLDKVHEDLAVANRELESKNKIISELETENLRFAETSLSKWGS